MEILFLGTGGAWALPEHACPCQTCRHLRDLGQSRTRTSLWVEARGKKVLIDPGPDLRAQLVREDLPRPDAVLISHEHGDHYLGLDELLCYRRAVPPEDWIPIPVWATEDAWAQIEVRFGYLLGSLLEKRLAEPGHELAGEPFGADLWARPVKTDHGPFAKGSVGYVLGCRQGVRKTTLGYTSDLIATPDPDGFCGLDLLVCQCHFFSEPKVNRANHLSLQNALPLLGHWSPRRVAFVHLSCQDFRPGDPANAVLKKYEPETPLADAQGRPYQVPRDQETWQAAVERVLAEHGPHVPALVAHDGLRLTVGEPC